MINQNTAEMTLPIISAEPINAKPLWANNLFLKFDPFSSFPFSLIFFQIFSMMIVILVNF